MLNVKCPDSVKLKEFFHKTPQVMMKSQHIFLCVIWFVGFLSSPSLSSYELLDKQDYITYSLLIICT